MKIIKSKEINYRVDFPLLCNARGVRVAVEVGTDRGVFARQFMERFKGDELVCIDPYCQYEELPACRDIDRMMAVMALMPWHGRVRFYQTTSTDAAANFPWWLKDRIDFVYVDAEHTFDEAYSDIATWWELLTPQGILAGHDYDITHSGVMKAVDQFAKENDLVVRIVAGDSPESWYIYKNEPPSLFKYFFDGGEIANED